MRPRMSIRGLVRPLNSVVTSTIDLSARGRIVYHSGLDILLLSDVRHSRVRKRRGRRFQAAERTAERSHSLRRLRSQSDHRSPREESPGQDVPLGSGRSRKPGKDQFLA